MAKVLVAPGRKGFTTNGLLVLSAEECQLLPSLFEVGPLGVWWSNRSDSVYLDFSQLNARAAVDYAEVDAWSHVICSSFGKAFASLTVDEKRHLEGIPLAGVGPYDRVYPISVTCGDTEKTAMYFASVVEAAIERFQTADLVAGEVWDTEIQEFGRVPLVVVEVEDCCERECCEESPAPKECCCNGACEKASVDDDPHRPHIAAIEMRRDSPSGLI